jgi:cyclase
MRAIFRTPWWFALRIPVMLTAGFWGFSVYPAAAQGQPAGNLDEGGIQVLHVQGSVHLLAGAGGNVTVQTGDQGVFLVDSGSTEQSAKALAAIRKLSTRPIRYIVNTGIDADHTGGNELLSSAGITIFGVLFQGNNLDAVPNAVMIAHENAYNRMSGLTGGKQSAPAGALPMDVYPGNLKRLFFNDEGIEIIHVGSAHTDGDSMVYFRRSDVLSTGDIFSTTTYPVIDLANGGSVQGILDGLNRILEITISTQRVEGGTYVIPGHGRICDQFDVLEYRDMVTIVRDRIQALIKKGMSLEQIRATRPTEDYDDRYGSASGPWTTDMFVEAVYKSLVAKK